MKKQMKYLVNDTDLEICLHPMNDVMLADEDHMKNKLKDIINKCKHNNFLIRADTFMPVGKLKDQIEKIQQWQKVAHKVLG